MARRSARARTRRAGVTADARRWPIAAVGVLVTLVASVAASAFGTQAHQFSSPGALAIVAALGSFAGVLLSTGLPRERSTGVRQWLGQALAGAGGLAVAPWLVMANRYTDAPPGSEVVFLTASCWGAMFLIALAVRSPDRVRRLGGVLIALVGAAGVVANWERPSSFSPFVRFPLEGAAMLFAGVLWVLLMMVLNAARAKGSMAPAALRAALGGVAAAVVLAVVGTLNGTLTAEHFSLPGLWAFGIATGFAFAGVLVTLRAGAPGGVAGAYVLVPAAMSLLLLLEQVLGVRGPNPLLVGPVVAATVTSVAGLLLARSAVGVVGSSAASEPGIRSARSGRRRKPPLALVASALAALALVAALGSLALPALTATVTAERTDATAFEASFDLYGYETAGSWLAFGMAIVALGVALVPPNSVRERRTALAVALAAAAWWFVADTPLRTLTSFIPSAIQVDYGTEFARIVFTGGPSLVAATAAAGALAAVAITLLTRPWPSRTDDTGTAEDGEVIDQ